MFEATYGFLDRLLGLHLNAEDLRLHHMVWRSFVVFICAVLVARIGDRRFLGHNSGFDIMVLVMLGSVLSRAINGQAAFFPTLGASVFLVFLHDLAATAALRSHAFSKLLKGKPVTLVRDGRVDERAMAQAKITHDDLDEQLRLRGNVQDTGDVAEARLERNGNISVVRNEGRET